MAYHIELYKQPNTHNFSKNPILFGFHLSPFTEANVVARQRVLLTVMFAADVANPQYTELWSGTANPDKDGFCMIDISSILDAKLIYYTPNVNLLKLHKCTGQCGRFKLHYYLSDNNSILSDQEQSDEYYVYKGGVAKEDIDNDASFLNTTLVANRQPLHFYHDRELIRPTEPKWLYFIYSYAAAIPASEVSIFVNYYWEGSGVTNTYTALVQNVLLAQYQVYCIPVDMLTIDLEGNSTSFSNIYKYIVEIQDQNAEYLTSAQYFIDRRPFYDEQYLLYRNSIGALETQPVMGTKEHRTVIAVGTKLDTLALSDMLGDVTMQRERAELYNTHTATVKAHTGWIAKEVLLRLKDLLLNREVWTPYGKRLKPVFVTAGNLLLHNSNEGLFNLPIEFSNAYTDENYNPEGLVEFTDTCPSVSFIYGGVRRGGFIWVQWKLPPGYDKVEFTYTIDLTGPTVYTAIFSGNQGIANIDINSASNTSIVAFSVILKARVVCNNEVTPYSYGAYTSDLGIDGESLINCIANNDVADESDRSTAPRVLKAGGVDLNVLDNDLTANGGVLGFEGVYDVTGTTPIAISANGANVQQYGSGGILYTPTPASIAILNDDYIYYKCNEYISTYGYMLSNVASIRVPLAGAVPRVYVKLVRMNDQEVEHKFGLGNVFTMHDYIADYYLQFFKDNACTQPVNVTSFGLQVGFDIQLRTREYNSVGSLTSISAYAVESTSVISLIGTSMPFKINFYNSTFILTGGCDVEDRKILSNAGTSVGDVVFIGW